VSDTFDSDPNTLPPLTKAICEAWPTTMYGGSAGPIASDKALRAMLDAFHDLEDRVIALEP
jgi:hypothetical protein